MKNITLFVLSIALLSCGTRKNATKDEQSNSTAKPKETMITATIGELSKTSDPMTISSIQIDGNVMTVEVTYSGGCGEHSFQVIGSSTIAKSLPPIRSIQLVHNANKDECKKMIIQKIKVDISDLAYKKESGSEIYLTLEGWKEKVKYTFN